METTPTTRPDTVPGGSGTDQFIGLPLIADLAEAQQIDTDHPALRRALKSLEDKDGIISAFQSFTS